MNPQVMSLDAVAKQYQSGDLTEEQIHDHYGGETYQRVLEKLQATQYQAHYA